MAQEAAPRILVVSDCPSFAGCERMMGRVFDRLGPVGRYSFGFYFRHSHRYVDGLARFVRYAGYRSYRLRVPDANRLMSIIAARLGPARFPVMAVVRLFAIVAGIVEGIVVLGSFRPSVVHINNGGYPGAYSVYGFICALLAYPRVPSLYVVNNIASPPSRRDPIGWLLDRIVARTVTVFVTGSEAAGKALEQRFGATPILRRTIPNGVELPGGNSSGIDGTVARVFSSAERDGRLTIATVAVLEERKGHRFLIDAVKLIQDSDSRKAPCLVIEGTGSLYEALQQYAKDQEVENHVHFVGHVSEVQTLIQSADLFVLPSVAFEDFPNVILEAMMHGKPVVSTRVAGIPEQIVEGETGFVVEPRNPRALADSIQHFIDEPEAIGRMGAAGRARYERLYRAESSVASYDELYQELIKQDRRRSGR